MFLTWMFFAAFLGLRGYQAAARVCALQSLSFVIIKWLLSGTQKYKTIINLFMTSCAIGLLFVALSDPKLGFAIFFFPVSILVCSYLFGVKQASIWFAVTTFFFVLFNYLQYGVSGTIANHLDELMLSLGVAFCTFFCCQQAEASYQRQSKRMVDFSNALQKRSDELELLATTDSLTGLTNRFQFQSELDKLIKFATDQNQVALFLIDMDGFKEINDTLGHATGDEVLIEIGVRLSSEMGNRASVARLGGDEFCVLFSGVDNCQQADELAIELVTLLTDRYVLSDISVTLGTSVGYALCPEHAETGKTHSVVC